MRTMVNLIKRQIKWACFVNISLIGIALGQCAPAPVADAGLGSYPSFSVGTEGVERTKLPESGLTCDFSGVLTVLGGDKVDVTYGRTSQTVLQSIQDPLATIPYNLYMDTSMREPIPLGGTYKYKVKALLDLFGLLGQGQKELLVPLYIEVPPFPTANIVSGLYTANINLEWDWKICKGADVAGLLCLGNTLSGTPITNIILKLTIEPDCLIFGNDVYFGARAFVTEFEPVNGMITVTCTKGTAYSVGLDNGENAKGNQRRMKFGGYSIPYDIYKETGGRWGEEASERWASSDASERPGSGNGLRNGGQTYKYKAEIMSDVDNTPKPAGTYIDHVVIDIGF